MIIRYLDPLGNVNVEDTPQGPEPRIGKLSRALEEMDSLRGTGASRRLIWVLPPSRGFIFRGSGLPEVFT